jgi:hypothetical protein
VGLRALARRLWRVAEAPVSTTNPAGLGTLAPTADLPCRTDRDRRPGVGVADQEDRYPESPYGRGVTLVASREE